MEGRSDATVTLSQIAELAGYGASAVSNWRKRFEDFPRPVETAAGGRDLYLLADVEEWLRAHDRLHPERANERLVFEAANLIRTQAPVDEGVEIIASAVTLAHALDTLSIAVNGRAVPELISVVEQRDPDLRDVFTPLEELPAEAETILEIATRVDPADRVIVFEQVLDRRRRFVESRTSVELTTLIARLAEGADSMLDPAAGEGGFLVAAAESPAPPRRLYGQELNRSAWRIAKQRMFLRGIHADLRLGDSLLTDAFPDLPVDAVVCDPPYGAKNPLAVAASTDLRWGFNFARSQSTDFLWLLHAIQHADDDRRGYVLLPAGSLYRRGRDGELRKELLRSGAIEAIVALPRGAADRTQIPLALWIVRSPAFMVEAAPPVLLVDATAAESRRQKLDQALIDRIVELIRRWRETGALNGDDQEIAGAFPVLDLLAADAELVPGRWIYRDVPVDTQARATQLDDALNRFNVARAALTDESTSFGVFAAPEGVVEWVPVRELIGGGIAEIIRGVKVKDEDCQPAGARVLRTRDLREEILDKDPCFLHPDEMKPRPTVTESGDVVVSPASGQLRAIVDEEGGRILASPLQGLRFKKPWLDPQVAAAFLESPRNRRFAKGTVYARVDLKDLELPVLPEHEQQRLRDRLDQLARVEQAAQDVSASAREIRQTLVELSSVQTDGGLRP